MEGSQRPGYSNAKENVYRIRSRDVRNRRIGVLILYGRDFAGKQI